MSNWYTADTHFGHANIIKYCDRPFESTEEMDEFIIRSMSESVDDDDDLWILGDFAFGRQTKAVGYLSRVFDLLPGRKHLVVGNHDYRRTRALPWSSVHDIAQIKDGNTHLTLCHFPMLTWNRARDGALQLFGHVHNDWQGSRNSVNVGVDVWGFKPVQLEDIQRRAASLPVNRYWNLVERSTSIE